MSNRSDVRGVAMEFGAALSALLVQLAEKRDVDEAARVAATTDINAIGCAVVDLLRALEAPETVFAQVAIETKQAPIGVAALEQIRSRVLLVRVLRESRLPPISALALVLLECA